MTIANNITFSGSSDAIRYLRSQISIHLLRRAISTGHLRPTAYNAVGQPVSFAHAAAGDELAYRSDRIG